jgi:D-3-phosphoglycerate dehydrogenase
MRVLIADKLSPFVAGRLQDLGAQVTQETGLSGQALTARLGELDPEVLVVRSTEVSAADIAAAQGLALVIRAGAGVNTIDLDAASARGVYVTNCPGKNAAAVAELTLAHLLNLDRRIADNVRALREHRWAKKAFGGAPGLNGRTLAVLGTGTIGREVIARAKAFGMRIVAWSRSLDADDAEELGVERVDSPEDAVRHAQAVTVHLALTPETRHRVDASVFGAMRPGTYFINTSRGEVVDTQAMLDAVRDKGILVGLDVFEDEPPGADGTFELPLADDPNVYGTHHIGASTQEAEEAVGREVVRIVSAYKRGRRIPNCVNLAEHSPATHRIIVRHADRVGVLAGVLDVLREAGHNVQEMQNIVFSGAEAACARIEVVGEPAPETLRAIASRAEVFAVSASPIE